MKHLAGDYPLPSRQGSAQAAQQRYLYAVACVFALRSEARVGAMKLEPLKGQGGRTRREFHRCLRRKGSRDSVQALRQGDAGRGIFMPRVDPSALRGCDTPPEHRNTDSQPTMQPSFTRAVRRPAPSVPIPTRVLTLAGQGMTGIVAAVAAQGGCTPAQRAPEQFACPATCRRADRQFPKRPSGKPLARHPTAARRTPASSTPWTASPRQLTATSGLKRGIAHG